MTRTNIKWVLKTRPAGAFKPSDVQRVEEKVELEDVPEGKLIVEVDMLGVDAFVRTMLDETAYHGAIKVGDVVPALGFGTVLASSKGGLSVGTRVAGMLGAQTVATVPSEGVTRMMPTLCLPPSAALGVLGLTTGCTAYVGIYCAARRPHKGETVVVSAAAGAVGSIAAQLAKTTGARVIGIAGGRAKADFLVNTLKLDGAVDYKSEETVKDQLKALCPDGINFFFDNVGGEILDDVLEQIAPMARVVICGAVSQYSGNLNVGTVRGPSNYLKLPERGATMVGFNVIQYLSSLPMALLTLRWHVMMGNVVMHEQIVKGIDAFPAALETLFTGGHIGKMLVDVIG